MEKDTVRLTVDLSRDLYDALRSHVLMISQKERRTVKLTAFVREALQEKMRRGDPRR
jgi:hypothetical protein